jgi:hypothetical protein
MPELPDVETFKRVLTTNALRKTIERVVVSDKRILDKLATRGSSAVLKAPRSLQRGGTASTWGWEDSNLRPNDYQHLL